MYFIIEERTSLSDGFSSWREYERHAVLWTARNRVNVMLKEDYQLLGTLRIVGATPLDAVNETLGRV